MHVDQAGKQRGLRQVDRRVSRRRLDLAGGCDPGDPAALDDDGLARAQLTRAHVEQAAGADHGPLRRRRLRCRPGSRSPTSTARAVAATATRAFPSARGAGLAVRAGKERSSRHLSLQGSLGTAEYSRPEYAVSFTRIRCGPGGSAQGGARAPPPRAVRRSLADARRRSRRRLFARRAPSPFRATTCLRACVRGSRGCSTRCRRLGCATVQGQAVCLWPGQLQLDLGRERRHASASTCRPTAPSTCGCPGDAERWPQDVRLDGSPAPVFDTRGHPAPAPAPPAATASRGRFAWSRLPESLSVPPEIGLVDLRLDGQAVPRPRRDEAGLLWLRAGTEAHGEGESLRLQVFRHDPRRHPPLRRDAPRARGRGPRAGDHAPGSAPARHGSRVRLGRPAGAGREGRPARAGARRPLLRERRGARRGPPEGDRRSRRSRPRSPGRRARCGSSPPTRPQRQVELSGPTPIDPSRTELPEEWRALPAFLVEPGASLALKEVRRGEAEPPPDALTLARELWLDPDGRAASVRDHFGGTLRATTRLDLLPPGTLGRIAVDGQDQLVTAQPETKAAGVELRRSALQPRGRLAPRPRRPDPRRRLDDRRRAAPGDPPRPARLEPPRRDRRRPAPRHLDVALDAPRLLLRPDRDPGRPPALRPPARGRSRSRPSSSRHGEPGAPFAVWLSLVAAIALQRVAPAGWIPRLARLWFLASAAVLVVLVVPFARDQVRDALFPQVAEAGGRPAPAADRLPGRCRPEAGVPGGVVGGVVGGVAMNAPAAAATRCKWRKTRSTEASVARRTVEGGRSRPSPSGRSRSAAATPTTSPSSRTRRPSCRPAPAFPAGPGGATRSRGAGPWAATTRCGSSSLSPGMNRLLTLLRLAAARGARLRPAHRPLADAPPPAGDSRPSPRSCSLSSRSPAPARAQSETPSPELLQELQAAPHPPRALRAAVRHDAEPRPADRRQPPPAERRGPRRGRRHVAAPRPRRQLDPGRDPRRRRPRGRGRAARLGLPPPAPRARRPPRRGRGPGAPRRQLHAAVRRPAAARPGRGAGMGRQRPARRRPRRAVDPPHPPPRRPRRRRGRRGPLRPVARGHPHARASASRGPSRHASVA